VAVDAAGDLRGLGPLGFSELYAGEADILSVLGFPDSFGEGRAQATTRSGSGLPDVQRVLGDQATVDLGDGGALSFGQLPLVALSLVLLSSLLLVGALLPPVVIALTPVSPARFARVRQPLAFAAIAILVPVAVGSLASALS
jgi:hypothetical protein